MKKTRRLLVVFVSFMLVVILSVPVFAGTSSSKKEDAKKEDAKDEDNKDEVLILFKGYEWGTSVDEIMKREIKSSMKEGVDYAYFKDDRELFIIGQSVAGYDCSTLFEFDNDENLISGYYMLTESHSNEQQYYYDYQSLVKKLIGIYGEPSDENEVWYDDLWRDDYNKEGMAIITGDLAILTEWEDSKGNSISIMITGDNYDCSTVLIYRSNGYEAQENTSGL